MSDAVQVLGITKEVWDKIPEEYQQKIMKAVIERQIDLAKQLLAKVLGKGNLNPSRKFDPIAKVIADTYTTDFFGSKHWNPDRFINLCRMQGVTGTEVWHHETLSAPLKLLVQETKEMEEAKLDVLLHSFAATIGFDEAALRRHYFAIKFGYEDVFLVHVEKQEKKLRKLAELAETAESEVLTPEEPVEEEEEEE